MRIVLGAENLGQVDRIMCSIFPGTFGQDGHSAELAEVFFE